MGAAHGLRRCGTAHDSGCCVGRGQGGCKQHAGCRAPQEAESKTKVLDMPGRTRGDAAGAQVRPLAAPCPALSSLVQRPCNAAALSACVRQGNAGLACMGGEWRGSKGWRSTLNPKP